MSNINPVKLTPARDKDAHLNWMGGPSWDVKDPVVTLRMAAASCFFGEPQYYHSDVEDKRPRRISGMARRVMLTDRDRDYLRETLNGVDPQEWRTMSPTELMVSAIDRALDHDPERTLAVASALRNEDYIRTTPQVIMVRAAHHEKVWGTGLIRKYGAEIIKRPDEAATQLAYQIATFGPRPIPNSLKRAWAAAYERFNEYGLAKYKLKSRTVKTVDVVNLSHPASDAVNKLMRGELALNDETWEAYISQNGSNKDTWTSVLPRMGHMAVLRNLRNFMKFGVDVEAVKERLLKTQEGSMQLPFRYYSAYQAIQAAPDVLPSLLDTVEECLVNSIAAGPQFPGRVMSLCDNSGSAWGMTTSSMGTMHVAQIANLTGVITGMAADEGYVGVFGDRLEQVPVRKRDSLFEQTKRLDAAGQGIGGGTENGIWLFWDQAIRNKEHWDQVFVYSDMQAGHGGLYGTNSNEYRDYIWQGRDGYRGYIDVPKLISTYRQQVNPKVNVYLVQVAGYQDTIVPEYYDRTYILGGWSDSLLRFAAAMSGLGQAQQ